MRLRCCMGWGRKSVLNRPSARPFDEVRQFGAVIKRVEPDQLHVGFLYKLGDERARMVHLAWHNRLTDEDPVPDYFWIQCGLPDTVRNVIAPALAGVAQDQQLPYSPLYEGIYFVDGTLRYNRNSPGEGLTCATFLMAVLDALGYPLFNAAEWHARPEDEAWTERIIRRLAASPGVSTDHTEAIRARPRGARFRPEEVSGSLSEAVVPVSFVRAEQLGRQLLQELPPEDGASPQFDRQFAR
jgi:hypothetical protein